MHIVKKPIIKSFPLQAGKEFRNLVPEAVHEKDGYKGVDYARLVPLLIESIKEQNKKMEEQQKQIDEQRKMIQQLLNK